MSPLEPDLETLHQHPTPDPAFAARLQRDLRARAERLETPAPQPARAPRALPAWGLFRRTWTTAALAFVLILAALVLFADPQRVWAGIQQFFRYVPGVGFVDLENARVLSAPVAVEREGITFIVTQVLATTDRTMVRFEVQGLPPAEEIWANGGERNDDFHVQLRLSEDATLDSGGMMLGLENGQIEFPALPADTALVFLEFDYIPLLPPGMFPEQWSIPLTLQPLEGEPDTALFPEPYMPENATDSHFGITATVLQVAQASEGAAVQLAIASDGPAWSTSVGGFFNLRDDIGHSYAQSYEESASSVQVMEVVEEAQGPNNELNLQTYVFYPTSLMARELTLEIPEISRSYTLKGSFTVDVGENPQVGDSWTLNIPFEFEGIKATILSAHLTKETYHNEDTIEGFNKLEFLVRFEPDPEGRKISSFYFENADGYFQGGGAETPNDPKQPAKVYVELDASQPFPTGVLTFNFEHATIAYPGPWILTWPIPRGENDPASSYRPVILHPDARDTQNDLTLSISETVQTDRLFALALEAENLPAGTEFLWPIAWGTDPFNPTEVTLSDNLGNAIPSSNWETSWGAYQNDNLTRAQTHLNFALPHPLASKLTLTIPAVHLFMHAQTSFDITLPPDKVPLRGEINSFADYPPKEAWEVDVPLEIAGFQAHFTHAWVQEEDGWQTLILFAEDVIEQVGNFHLTAIQMETVQSPDGQTWNVPPFPMMSGSAGQIPGTSTYVAELRIATFAPEQQPLLPGTYHVQLNGVLVTVPGPWELGWDLLGP
ncbi:MAG: anti-sigma factor [Anaerolineales bacterium]|nr:anti-sigma factor [Anaerolineales bacterium]